MQNLPFKIFTLTIAAVLLILALNQYQQANNYYPSNNYSVQNSGQKNNSGNSSGQNISQNLPLEVVQTVPFTPQAPTGNWSDPREQSGCEEASMIMADAWIHSVQLPDPSTVEQKLWDIAQFEQTNYGNFYDTNAADTNKVFKAYFGDSGVVKYNFTIDDLRAELASGHIVLIPANGVKLNNPYYKQPGPMTHMLVVTGYNDVSHRFITNDPGTKHGQDYQYDYNVLYNAAIDYPTGHDLPQIDQTKAMIVVAK